MPITKNQFIKVLEKSTEAQYNNILFLDKSKTSSITYDFKNSLELLDLIVHLYCVVVAKIHLSPYEKIALRHYINSGYNELTKDAIRKECRMGVTKDSQGKETVNLKKAAANLTQVNFKMEQKGVLTRKHYKEKDKEVNKEIMELRDKFLQGKAEVFNIKFKKVD